MWQGGTHVIIPAPKFLRQFKKLPLDIQLQTNEIVTILKTNPFDARLKTHKMKFRRMCHCISICAFLLKLYLGLCQLWQILVPKFSRCHMPAARQDQLPWRRFLQALLF